MVSGGSNKSSGKQSSVSNSESQSTNQSFGSGVWGEQSPYLQSLYAAGNNAMAGGAPNQFETLGQSMMTQGANTLGQMQQGGVNPQAAAYAQRMGQDFREQFLPGLQGQAIQAGGLGGSRQQIGAALGADRAMQGQADFNANIYGQDQDRRLQAAQSGMQGGMQTADFGRGMPWYNLQQQAGLLGGPTTLDLGSYGQSTSKSTSSSTGKSSSGGWNFGFGG